MAQIEGLQVNIVAKIDQLQKALDDTKKGLASVAQESERQAQKISNPLTNAADAIQARYGNLAGTLATNLASLVNPATLAASAITAIGAALLAYYNSIQEKVPTVDESLKSHSELIKAIKASYGEAMVGLEQYTKESENSFRNRLGASVAVLQAQLQGVGQTFANQFGVTVQNEVYSLDGSLQTVTNTLSALPAKFEPFRSAIEAFQQSVRDGQPNFVAFRDEVDRIGAAAVGVNPEINKTAVELAEAARQGYQAQQGISAASSAMSQMTPEARAAANAVNNFNAAMKALEGVAPAKKTDRFKVDEEYFRGILGNADPNQIRQLVQARNDAISRIEAEEAAKVKPVKGGAADNSAEQLAREQEMITKRLEMLTLGWGTEQERLAAHLVRNQDLITQARSKEVIDDETHKMLMLGAEEEYQKKMEAMRMAGINSALTATGEVFSAMGRVVQSGGKKNVRLAKMFGIAEAIIATMVAANKAMAVSASAGPAAAFAAWAAVAAKGLATVAAIRSVNEGGGGGGGAASAGGGGGAASGEGMAGAAGGKTSGGSSVYINLQGQSFGRDQVRDLVKQIADFQKDGGQVVFA